MSRYDPNIEYHVIHLKHHRERLMNIQNNRKKLGKDIDIFNAVVGKDVDLDNLQVYDPLLRNQFNHDFIGEIGCYLSHMMLIKSLFNSINNYAVIFEDDFYILEEDLHSKIVYYLKELEDEDFDILILGNFTNNKCTLFKSDIYTINPNEHMWGTHAYLIKNTNARKIYNLLLTMSLAIDNKFKTLLDMNLLKGYVVYPVLVDQQRTKLKSTITCQS